MSEENQQHSRALVNINSSLAKTQSYFDLISEFEEQRDSSEKKISVDINSEWKEFLKEEFTKPYFQKLVEFITNEYRSGYPIHPKGSKIFNAFNLCKLSDLKVVIIESDPHPIRCNLTGLAYSVNPDVRPLPKVISNIFKEISNDLGLDMSNRNGDLTHWANQGVLLLNNVLTCKEGQTEAHFHKGWEQFTDSVIEILNDQKEGLVYLLWGSKAQEIAVNVDPVKNLVLKTVNPSPLSAHRGFFGCQHFSKTNDYLKSLGKDPILW